MTAGRSRTSSPRTASSSAPAAPTARRGPTAPSSSAGDSCAGARGRGIGTTAVTQLLAETRRRYPAASIVAHTEWVADGEVMVADSAASEAILGRLGFVAEPPPTEPGYRAWRLAVT